MPFYNEDRSVLGPFIHSPLPTLTFTAAQRTKTERFLITTINWPLSILTIQVNEGPFKVDVPMPIKR